MSKTYKRSDGDREYKIRRDEKNREKSQNKKKFLYEKPAPPKDREKREY